MSPTSSLPIAIVGIGCRFPGARGPRALWRLLCDGVDAITEVPKDRFDIDAYYDPRPATPGKICTRWGGFIEGVDQFDPGFFGISPREATRMDPQQRLLLEVAWEALEDAAQVPEKLTGSQTGVYVGMCSDDYATLQFTEATGIDIYAATGGARSVISGRLSYVLGLQGPSLTVDTACSSSLVAVHLACQSLRSGECSLALAGGVNLILTPEPSMGFSQAKMLAPDGRCKAFDARGDGFIRSEGAGVVVLKPLDRAVSDGDPVYAIIRGTAVNNDGRDTGLMTPSSRGQEAMLREAYRNAGVAPAEVHYVEAHGTGTSVGDPIEARALGAVFSEGRPKTRPCLIGSVKTNIGHTEGAAGVAGLIKAALALKHRAIPANLHFERFNPSIPFEELGLAVPRELTPWPVEPSPARAGVSSFGISGTNAHVVLEEASFVPIGDSASGPGTAESSENRADLLTLSAHTKPALEELAGALRQQLIDSPDYGDGSRSLRDLCYTASARRAHHDHRLALTARSNADAGERLDAFLKGHARPGLSVGRRIPGRTSPLVFVFPGQGSQWPGMGRQLLREEPVFRRAIEECDAAMRSQVEWSLLDVLTNPAAEPLLDRLDVIQPAIFGIQLALAALWRAWGVEPDAVVGHSLGEVAAAHVAGILSVEDAARVICRRSLLVKRTTGQGGMAVVALSFEKARQAIDGLEDRVALASSNSPASTVLSGDREALGDLLTRLDQQGVFGRWVKVDYASHSPQMDALRPELLDVLGGIRPQRSRVAFHSTVTGNLEDGLALDAEYWARNLREPVLFFPVVEQLLKNDAATFLELSPHPILVSSIQQAFQHLGHEGVALASLRRGEDERESLLGTLGALYCAGRRANWEALSGGPRRAVSLPLYPFQRERYWMEAPKPGHGRGQSKPARSGQTSSLLLGDRHQSGLHPGTHLWDVRLDCKSSRIIEDHRIAGRAVLPAAVTLESALLAAAKILGDGIFELVDVRFRKALFLPDDDAVDVQMALTVETKDSASFQVLSLQPGGAWTSHVSGSLRRVSVDDRKPSNLDEIRSRCTEIVQGEAHYLDLRGRGYEYGPSLQRVEQIFRRPGEALGRVRGLQADESVPSANVIPAALLDACLQVSLSTLLENRTGAYLPVQFARLCVHGQLDVGEVIWSHARIRGAVDPKAPRIELDIDLLNPRGEPLAKIGGLVVQRLEAGPAVHSLLDRSLFTLDWQPRPLENTSAQSEPTAPKEDCWLVLADRGPTTDAVVERLTLKGDQVVVVSPGDSYQSIGANLYRVNPSSPSDLTRLIKDLVTSDRGSLRGAVHLWGISSAHRDEVSVSELEQAQEIGSISLLHLVQALVADRLAPRLTVVTNGAVAAGTEASQISVAQSSLWGLGRVVSHEHPELRCTKIDLPACPNDADLDALVAELLAGDREDQVAVRDGQRLVARLTRASEEAASPRGDVARVIVKSRDSACRLEIGEPGRLDSLIVRACNRKEPGAGEVEIEVVAAGLNFSDVLKGLGLYPGLPPGLVPIGIECSGRIATVGDGVEGLHVGDPVVAIAPFSFGRWVTIPAAFVAPKPAHLSFDQAAALPIAYLTASYALEHLGRMAAGERVLIHAAAGGVGLAAVDLAQAKGATVFATAGTPEKREFLRSLGVKHVMDSRSLRFAEEVLEITGGQGVDLVLNSLAGEALEKSLSVLGPYGRFLEIGKRDIYENSRVGLSPFRHNLSFHAIDLDRLFRERTEFAASLFREVIERVGARSAGDSSDTESRNAASHPSSPASLHPSIPTSVHPSSSLPVTVYPIREAQSAFRAMAQAQHIGKIVVSLEDPGLEISPALRVPVSIRSDATYLITGGLGGLGLSVARWMVGKGARSLALLGRNPAGAGQEPVLEELRKLGAEVRAFQGDVSSSKELDGVLSQIRRDMPPIRGVVHAAGFLDDGILTQQTAERFRRVMAPKVSGSWLLHVQTRNDPIEFFVLFSSAASLLGSPGQANYSAANAFLDALAHHRRALGLPALSINWGPWSEVGLAARPDRGGRLAYRGFESLTPEQGTEVFGRLLERSEPQIAVLPVDWKKWREFYPTAGEQPLFASILTEDTKSVASAGSPGSSRATVLSAPPAERRQWVEAFLSEHLSKVLGFSGSRLSKLDVDQPLNTLGLDSLMAVELKNRVEAGLGIVLPVATLLQGPSIAKMATQILTQLEAESGPPFTVRPEPVEGRPSTGDRP